MKLELLALSLFASLILVSVSTATPQAQTVRNDTVAPFNSIAPDDETTVERTTIFGLREIAQARSDIHHKNWSSAQLHLTESARLMEMIEDDLSTATTKNFIQIARKHLEYESAKQVLQELPSIYLSLDTISFYIPTDKTKLHIDKAADYLKNNHKMDAEKELLQADKSLVENEMRLPLLKMQIYLAKAQRYLATKNYSKANEALQTAESRGRVLYTGIRSPLHYAERNLWLAFRNFSTATQTETGTHLAQAKNYLNKVATVGSAKDKEEAGKLSSELDTLEKKLAGEGKVAESDLKTAWEKSKALVERSAAYLSAGLSEEETPLGKDSNLIEARLHVMYAQTYHLTTAEPVKAIIELDAANSYLQKASEDTLTDAEDRKRMHEISNVLMVLKKDDGLRDISVKERYYNVEEEIENIIDKEQLDNLSQKIR